MNININLDHIATSLINNFMMNNIFNNIFRIFIVDVKILIMNNTKSVQKIEILTHFIFN
jgi:hypothetical protein